MKFAALNLMPRIPLIWLMIMTEAVAEVKPLVTGSDINSTRKPLKKQRKRFNIRENETYFKHIN
jgi:hypothetical protein